MALTAASIFRQMTHAIDGGEPSSELSLLDIANQAGEWLYDFTNWRWKSRPPVALATVTGQTYIELPDDFGEMIGIPRGPSSFPYPIRMTSIEQIAALRAITNPTSPSGFYGALVYTAADQDTQAPPKPRIEIWPPPSEDNATVAMLYYTASWVELTDDDDIANVPRYCNRLLIECARAFLSGLEDEEQGTTDERLDRIVNGHLLAAAVMRDQGEQNDYGQMPAGPTGLSESFGDPSPYPTYQLPTS